MSPHVHCNGMLSVSVSALVGVLGRACSGPPIDPRGATMSEELNELLSAAREVRQTDAQNEEQRRSFAFGNTNIENDRITRATVDAQAEELKHK